jgi:hypothetical protein
MNDKPIPVDFKFRAQLYVDDPAQFIAAPCEITLPQKIGERPKIKFYPEGNIDDFLPGPVTCKMQGHLGEGKGSVKIFATGIGFRDSTERYWGEGLCDRSVSAYAETLQIKRLIPSEEELIRASFYLSDSILLSPFDLITLCHDGTVTNDRGDVIKFEVSEGVIFTFENEYKYRKSGNERVCWPVLTARVNIPATDFKKDNLLSAIDEFLLLVSFAESRRIACLEVAWHTDAELVHEYRMNRAVPPAKEHHSFNACLIDINENLHTHLQSALVTLRKNPQHTLVLGAIAGMTLFDEGTIGTNFIRIFSAFEALVLAFRRTHNLEYSLPNKSDRDELEKHIKSSIKDKLSAKSDAPRRKLIYDNLPGLFRISLRQAAERFFEHEGISTNDVWPAFDSTNGISLIQIRNKIAHGENFSRDEWRHIAKALKSLVLIANRCMLATLGISYQSSRAHITYDDAPHWEEARRFLTESQAAKTALNQ